MTSNIADELMTKLTSEMRKIGRENWNQKYPNHAVSFETYLLNGCKPTMKMGDVSMSDEDQSKVCLAMDQYHTDKLTSFLQSLP